MHIEKEITQEAKRLIARHETKRRLMSEDRRRRINRSTNAQIPQLPSQPSHWSLDRGFNPYFTRARVEQIAYSIRKRLMDRNYIPRNPVTSSIQKTDGGSRQTCIYQVADSAISRMLFENISKKNLPILSSRAYAYRKDISAQNAIQYVKSEFKAHRRLFIAEYDFSKFFDNIEHEHIRRILTDKFLLTEIERQAIEGFLRVAPSDQSSYESSGNVSRERGIPQGTSISLFLANVAAWELDRELEKMGVGFVRYADDTLIWAIDYNSICNAVNSIYEQANHIGVTVNAAKSPGVRLLIKPGDPSEIKSTHHIDYLGYRLGIGVASLKSSTIDKIKKRIEQLIYWGLLCEPLRQTQNPERLSPNVDRDYVSTIWRIRRYLYGNLSEKAVGRYQRQEIPLRRFQGIMSAYPLVDDTNELKELDNWIFTRLFLTVRKRTSLLRAAGFGPDLPPPHDYNSSSLRTLETTAASTGETIDLTVPSVRRIASVLRSAAAQHGPSVIGKSNPYRKTDFYEL